MKKVVIVRHGNHKNNRLTPKAIAQARATGETLTLEYWGIKIDRVVTSPQWRCVETAMEILTGYGEMVPFTGTEPFLGDLAMDGQISKETKDNLKEEVISKYGEANDTNIAKLIYEDEEYHSDMLRRAYEGAKFIRKLLLIGPADAEETTLVVSHGVGRIEPTINVLKGGVEGVEILNIVDDLFGPGEARILYFEDGELSDIKKL